MTRLKENPKKYPHRRFAGAFTGLRGRLIILVLLASLPLLSLIVYTNIEQRRNDSEETRHTVLSVVRQASKEQLKLIDDARLLLSVLAQAVGSVSEEELSLVLRNTLEYQKAYANIGLIGPDGMLSASALPFDPPVYLGEMGGNRGAAQAFLKSTGATSSRATTSENRVSLLK